MNKEKIQDETRLQIAQFLPDAIMHALQSYHRFSQQRAPDEAKEFSAHHNACKVAITHIELLIKLAKWAELPDANIPDNNKQIILATMLQEAEEEVTTYNGHAPTNT